MTYLIWFPDGSSVLTQDRGYAERMQRRPDRRVEVEDGRKRWSLMPAPEDGRLGDKEGGRT